MTEVRSESESEVFRDTGTKFPGKDRPRNGSIPFFCSGESGTVYCGKEEQDSGSTTEETILILGEQNNGEVRTIQDISKKFKIRQKTFRRLHPGIDNGPRHQMKQPNPPRASILKFHGWGAGVPVIDSMSDSDGESCSPSSRLEDSRGSNKTPIPEDCLTLDDIHSVLDKFDSDAAASAGAPPPLDNDIFPKIEMKDKELAEKFSAATRQRKAIYRRTESSTHLESRQRRLQSAFKSRQDKLKSSPVTVVSRYYADKHGHMVNALTRDIMVLSGDRHGPFVGRPSIVRPSRELYPEDVNTSLVDQRQWDHPSTGLTENVNLRVPPTTLQISVLDIEPARWSTDFVESSPTPKTSKSQNTPRNFGEMSREEVSRRTEEAIRRNEERKVIRDRRSQLRKESKLSTPRKKRAIDQAAQEEPTSRLNTEASTSVRPFPTPMSTPRTKPRRSRARKIDFEKDRSVELPRKQLFECDLSQNLHDDLASVLRTNDHLSETVGQRLQTYLSPTRAQEDFPALTISPPTTSLLSTQDTPSYETSVYQSIYQEKLKKSKPRLPKKCQRSTVVQVNSPTRLSSGNSGNLISRSLCSKALKTFSLSEPTQNGRRLVTNLRRLSKEPDRDQNVPDRAAPAEIPLQNDPPQEDGNPLEKKLPKVLPSGILLRRSSRSTTSS